jgi:hypothetical protein
LRPRARLLRAFGDELISSETVALTELVKNSYDADATGVLIRFVGPLDVGTGRIEVVDNGHGMSLETIQTTWMEPGTMYRKRHTRSEEFGRRVLGEKGIGRFAASRLANNLEVITRRLGSQGEVHVEFDWSQFDDDSLYLSDIQAHWWETPPEELTNRGSLGALLALLPASPSSQHGTVLRMSGLRDGWDEAKLTALRSTLAKIVAPISDGVDVRANFGIYLVPPDGMGSVAGRVEPAEFLGQPHYSIGGWVAEDGHYQLEVRFRGSSAVEKLSGVFAVRKKQKPECGPFRIELRAWDRDASSMRELAAANRQAVRDVQQDLNEAAGVNIYRDGFRVLPYGEPRNDWLRLDLRRVQNPTLRISNNQIVGYVAIGADANPDLRDQTNREGLIEGRAFDDLRSLVVQVLAELEQRRFVQRRTPKQDARQGGVFTGFDLSDLRELVGTTHPKDLALLAAVETKQEDLDRRIGEAQEVLARYRRLATLGQLIDSVLHNGRTPLAKLRSEAELALRDLTKKNESAELLIRVRRRLDLVVDQAAVLAGVFRRIEPFGGRKTGRPSTIVLEDVIVQSFEVLRGELDTDAIEVELPTSRTQVTADPTEIQEVFVNLITNSIYWLERVPKGKRTIAVDVRRQEDYVEFEFSDSGPGVDPRYRDQIFEPYFSMKQDGVGLGLTLAGEIIKDYYGGELELLNTGSLPGATFRATLRRRV